MAEKPSGALATFLVFLAIGATGLRIYYRWKGPHDRKAHVAAMASDGQTLLAAVGVPPDATPHEKQWSNVNDGKLMPFVTLRQEYARPGRFADTVEWYGRELPQRGWRAAPNEFESDTHHSFCRGEWSLVLTRTMNFEHELPPEHRFQLDLSWYGGSATGCSQPVR